MVGDMRFRGSGRELLNTDYHRVFQGVLRSLQDTTEGCVGMLVRFVPG